MVKVENRASPLPWILLGVVHRVRFRLTNWEVKILYNACFHVKTIVYSSMVRCSFSVVNSLRKYVEDVNYNTLATIFNY